MEECDKVMDILNKYEEASGQKVNRSKTSLFFSKSIPEEVKRGIKVTLGVPEIMQYKKYLGLPSLVGKGKKASFNYIKEKVWRKLQGWEAKLLSQTRREVLLKAVIQAIPTYTMGCFKLLVSLCNEIESLIKKFWWGQKADRRKIHWVKWEEMKKSKTIGGMGFRDLAMFNDSLLAKQARWLLHNKTSLFYKIFKAHFFPNSSLIEVADSRLGSYAWKSILRGRDIIQRGAIWRVGSGEKINIWQQHWLPRKHPPRQPSCPIESVENHIVDSLIDPITRKWNEELIDGLFVEEDAELIKRIPLSQIAKEDSLYWPYSTSGHYICKSSYNFLKQESKMQDSPQAPPIRDKQVWKEIWQLKVPPKIKNFLWRACRNALPTKQALMKRKIAANSICERCKSAVEEAERALWSCLELEVVWVDHEVWSFRSEVGFSDVKELVSWLIAEGKPLEMFAYTAWMVWNQRNKARLNLQAIPLHQVADQAKELLAQYRVNLQVPKAQLMNSGSRGSRWRCPQVGLVKINFDGVVCSEANMSGIGVVIRDDKGAVLASCSKKIPRAYKADEIEALAAMKALSFAFELGFWSAILEGDSLGFIQALKSEEQSLAPTGLLIEDVKMFANNYVRLLYSQIKRNGNRVAHSLAKNALRIPDFQVWMEDIPSHIVSILQLDVIDLH